ncbi:MAG: hypothetical protein U0R71_15080 [Solirubrobacterales bacterium]
MEISILSRRQAGVARLVGTGRDPRARIACGEVTLMRREHPLYREFIANGYAEEVAAADPGVAAGLARPTG